MPPATIGSAAVSAAACLYAPWLNCTEAYFQALRYFTLDGTDHASQQENGLTIPHFMSCRTATLATAHYVNLRSVQTSLDAALTPSCVEQERLLQPIAQILASGISGCKPPEAL
jgi:hypothetical protein